MKSPVSLHDDYLRTPVEFEKPPQKDHLFLWTVFLLLLVGFSMTCWIGSYLLFNRPEIPLSYSILRKIKKIDLPQRFKVVSPPPGEFLRPEQIYNRFNSMTPAQLRAINLQLERAYLRNYPNANELVPYVTGRFTILASYELGAQDFVTSGVATLAVSSDYPKLLIEHLYCANPKVAPIIKRNLQTGTEIEMRRTFELTAVLHVTKVGDGHLQLTVVPLNYGSYVFKGNDGGFSLEPPTQLNVAAGWPVIRGERYQAADQAYVAYRTQTGIGPLVGRNPEGEQEHETVLKGVDTPVAAETPAPAVTPPPAQVAKADTKAAPGAKKSPVPTTPALVAQNNLPVRKALPVETPVPVNVVKAAAPGTGANGVSLQPFLQDPHAAPSAIPGAAIAASAPPVVERTWPTYVAGRQPGGRNVHVGELTAFNQSGGLTGEPVYLSGQFTVRALGENKSRGIKNAVLRSGAENNVRVIVEYPSDCPLPAQGADIDRDSQRPFLITHLQATPDGTLNVYAREIMAQP